MARFRLLNLNGSTRFDSNDGWGMIVNEFTLSDQVLPASSPAPSGSFPIPITYANMRVFGSFNQNNDWWEVVSLPLLSISGSSVLWSYAKPPASGGNIRYLGGFIFLVIV